MHELSIARNIVAIVSERAGTTPVVRVTLEVGALSGVMAEAIAFCFSLVAEGTPCANAQLQIREIAGCARCLECGLEFDQPRLGAPCPCGSIVNERISGHELNVKEMELQAA